MQTGYKPVYNCLRVYLVILLLLMIPMLAIAGIQLDFEWDPNPEPDIAGYRVFSREPGQDYDYGNPAWEGGDSSCSIFVDYEDAVYLFVVRAFDEDGFESDDSNEVVYPGDGEYTNEDEYLNESRYVAGDSSSSEGGCFVGTIK